MVTYLTWIIVLLSAVGLVLSIAVGVRQQKHTFDESANKTTAKHTVLANPIVIAYVLFPVVIVIGAVILMLNS